MIDGPGKPFTWGGTGYAVSAQSQYKEATFDLLKYIFFSVEGCENYFNLMDGEIIPYRPFMPMLGELTRPDPFFGGQDVGKTIVGWLEKGAEMRPLTKYDEVAGAAIGLIMDSLRTEDLGVEELFQMAIDDLEMNIPFVD